jgi:hypothetical protein
MRPKLVRLVRIELVFFEIRPKVCKSCVSQAGKEIYRIRQLPLIVASIVLHVHVVGRWIIVELACPQ